MCNPVGTLALLFPELLSVQSAEENDFVINYSHEVWRGSVNVWLGMYYDTNSKYHVNGGPSVHAGYSICHEIISIVAVRVLGSYNIMKFQSPLIFGQ